MTFKSTINITKLAQNRKSLSAVEKIVNNLSAYDSDAVVTVADMAEQLERIAKAFREIEVSEKEL